MGNWLVYLGGCPAQPDGLEQQKRRIIKKNVRDIRKKDKHSCKITFYHFFLISSSKTCFKIKPKMWNTPQRYERQNIVSYSQ